MCILYLSIDTHIAEMDVLIVRDGIAVILLGIIHGNLLIVV